MLNTIIKIIEWLDCKADGKISEHFENRLLKRQKSYDYSKYEEFTQAIENPYAESRVGTDKYKEFNLKLAQKLTSYLSLDNIFMTMSGEPKNFPGQIIEAIFEKSENQASLNADSTFVPYPWSPGNLTGNTNAYHGVVGYGFVHDPRNHKGFYFKDLDLAFVFNGNHSISIGTLMNDVKIATNPLFPEGTLNQKFFTAKITYDSITFGDVVYQIDDWKLSVILYAIQKAYKVQM